MIQKVKGGYQVVSSKGKNLGGPYKTLEEAIARGGVFQAPQRVVRREARAEEEAQGARRHALAWRLCVRMPKCRCGVSRTSGASVYP
jgi:hypothetical protein